MDTSFHSALKEVVDKRRWPAELTIALLLDFIQLQGSSGQFGNSSFKQYLKGCADTEERMGYEAFAKGAIPAYGRTFTNVFESAMGIDGEKVLNYVYVWTLNLLFHGHGQEEPIRDRLTAFVPNTSVHLSAWLLSPSTIPAEHFNTVYDQVLSMMNLFDQVMVKENVEDFHNCLCKWMNVQELAPYYACTS